MSALDGRIRMLAREEADKAVKGVGVLNTTALDTQGLQQQITDLHEHLHHAATAIKRLEDRIHALEKVSGPTDQEQAPARRTRRKTTDE
jgi:hypothetical protein